MQLQTDQIQVSLAVKTALSNGMVLLVNTEKRRLAVSLKDGSFQVSMMTSAVSGLSEAYLLDSPHALNDLSWHQVIIDCDQDECYASIDGAQTSVIKTVVAGYWAATENRGIYIGGGGGLTGSHDEAMTNFRGCIANLTLNKRDLLSEVNYSAEATSTKIWPYCSFIFAKEVQQWPIKFQSRGFLLYDLYDCPSSLKLATDVIRVSFDVMSSDSNCIIMKCSSKMILQRSNDVILRLVDGSVAISVDDGQNSWFFHSNAPVSVEVWHKISIIFHKSRVTLQIDNKTEEIFPTTMPFKHVSLGPLISIGYQPGEENLGAVAPSNFRGCLKQVLINDYSLILANAREFSADVSPGCSRCNVEKCHQYDQMVADLPAAAQLTGTTHSGDSNLTLSFLLVDEQSRAVLLPRYFDVLLRRQQGDLNAVFSVSSKPHHGEICKFVDRALCPLSTFSYQDLLDRVISYVHDGSETETDEVNFDIEIFGAVSSSVPERLQVRLAIKIEPVNDAPKFLLPHGGAPILIPERGRRTLNRYLVIVDPDNRPEEVMVTVTMKQQGGSYLQDIDAPEVELERFTQKQLLDGRILCVNRQPQTSNFTLIANDLLAWSESIIIQIVSFPVRLKLVRNTGLNIIQYSSEVVTADNLLCVSNDEDGGDIVYSVIEPPSQGYVELEKSANQWWIVQRFSQLAVNQSRVRYRHTKVGQSSSVSDFMWLKATMPKSNFSTELNFTITFMALKIKIFNPKHFIMNDTKKQFLSHAHLFVWTVPVSTSPKAITYQVVKAPYYGFLNRVINPETDRNRRLGVMSNFTQWDIDNHKLYYQLRQSQYTVVHDQFSFRVVVANILSAVHRFDITYIPGTEEIRLVNRTLLVNEGEVQRISNKTLHLEMNSFSDFSFKIVVMPKHGELLLEEVDGRMKVLLVGSKVTTGDIDSGSFYFRHDDSESLKDATFITAYPSVDNDTFQSGMQISFWLNFEILLNNDNPPQRLENNVFHVIRSEERVLTADDLLFKDDDIDFDDHQLQYNFHSAYLDGGFYSAKLPDVQIHIFTQGDIINRNVKFRHLSAVDEFTLPFFVTDGKFVVKDYLKVSASKPFLSASDNRQMYVTADISMPFSKKQLKVATNLNVEKKDIVFDVLSLPDNGKIFLLSPTRNVSVETFTLQDVEDGHVYYLLSDDSSQLFNGHGDFVQFLVTADYLETKLSLQIVLGQVQKNGLMLRVANSFQAVAGGFSTIGPTVLHAHHPRGGTKNIVYTVRSPPMHGILIVDTPHLGRQLGDNAGSSDKLSVTKFTQWDVDNGLLHYFHDGSSTQEDNILLAVGLRNETAQNVLLKVTMIESYIELYTRNLSVNAGEHVTIDSKIIKCQVADSLEEVRFVILQPPVHGRIESLVDNSVATPVKTFSDEQLKLGKIRYKHDGSASFVDQVSFKAVLHETKASSEWSTIFISIKHQNLQAPKVVRNEPFEMWNRRVAAIVNEWLLVEDVDTGPADLKISVSSTLNGYVAFKENAEEAIYEFSQIDVNEKRVVFVRQGNAESGGFSFIVSDGLHQIVPYWFTVRATNLTTDLERNEKLTVGPLSNTPITWKELQFSVGKLDASSLIFTVNKKPMYGDVMSSSSVVNRFTQLDINNGKITYNQSRHIRSWSSKDMFLFDLSIMEANRSQEINIVDHKFKIYITYAALSKQRMKQYLNLKPLEVLYGQNTPLNWTHLNLTALSVLSNSDLISQISSIPKDGWLQLNGRNVLPGDTVTEHGFQQSLLTYNHRSMSNDCLVFDIMPKYRSLERRKHNRLRATLDVVVKTSNSTDKPLSEYAIFLKPFTLIRGQSNLISNADLLQKEDNKLDADFLYQIQTPPLHSTVNVQNLDGSAVYNVTRFTQNQLIYGFVYLQHDGTMVDDLLTFTTTDSEHNNTYGVRLTVQPLTLKMTVLKPIEYRQTAKYVVVDNTSLSADSNGPRSDILFNITTFPSHGLLQWRDGNRIYSFTQADIDAKNIIYVKTSTNFTEDSYRFVVSNAYNIIRDNLCRIIIVPAVQCKDFIVDAGSYAYLTDEFLTIDEELTSRQATFVIVKPPSYGQLLREATLFKGSSNGNAQAQDEVKSFTAADLSSRAILYKSSLIKNLHSTLVDYFVYDLKATDVQTARGQYPITIMSKVGGIQTRVDHSSTDKTQQKNDGKNVGLWTPNMTTDHSVVLYVVVPVIVSAIVILFLLYIYTKRKRRQQEKMELCYISGGANETIHANLLEDQMPSTVRHSSGCANASCSSTPIVTIRRPRGPTIKNSQSLDVPSFEQTYDLLPVTDQVPPPPPLPTLQNRKLHTFEQPTRKANSTFAHNSPGNPLVLLLSKPTTSTGQRSDSLNRFAYRYGGDSEDRSSRELSPLLHRKFKHRRSSEDPASQIQLRNDQYWV